MSFLTRFALDNTRLTMVFIAAVILLGLNQFLDFPRQEDPPITIREIVVVALYPGMKPADMEDLVTRRLEAQIRTLPEIDDIWSDSKTGISVIHAETRDEYDDLDTVWQKIRNKMRDIKPELPSGTIGPFVNDEFGLTAVATMALWADGFSMAEMRLVARDIRDRLYELKGVRKVELYGVQEEQIFLKFSASKLSQFGISLGEIYGILIQQNVVLPGGRIDAAGQDIIVEPSGNFRSVEDIERVLIPIPGTQQTVALKDLVKVERGYIDPAKDLAYFNGRQAIVISVSIIPGTNSVAFGGILTQKLNQLEAGLPIGYVLEYATFQPDLVEAAVNGGLSNVYQTLVIVLVVVMLFLGVRTGLIVGSFVPMTMLLGMITMRFFDIELERVSIASSIIALGMLVDNGIVVAEDIRTRLENGEDKRQACLETGRTLAIPLLTSSMTTILAFVPMLLIDGQTGDYAFSLPMVVILLLISSWCLSMYMTPAMCWWFMKVKPKAKNANANAITAENGLDDGKAEEPYSGRFYRIYGGLLKQLLRFRVPVLILAACTLLFGGFVSTQLVREFFGPSERNQFLIYLDLPAGSRIQATEKVVNRLTTWLSNKDENPEIASTIAYVGTGGPRFFLVLSPFDPDPHLGFVVVNTQEPRQVPELVERVRQHLMNAFPGVSGRVKQMWMGAEEPGFLEIRLYGLDPNYLFKKGNQLAAGIKAIPGTLDVKSTWENMVPKATVVVDQARARRAGITSNEVAISLKAHMDGAEVTEYREGDLAIPVVFRSMKQDRIALSDFLNVSVYSREGASVALTQIADLKLEWDYSRISRRNQEKCLTVEGKHEFLKAPELFAAIEPLIEDLDLEPGYHWEVGGELEIQAETMGKLTRWLPVCVFGILVLLIWQFNSFRKPVIIFVTIPLAFTGSFFGLAAMRAPFDFFAMLGLLSLAGVIINNGIVLLDKIDTERGQGAHPYSAVLTAAISRFRPILMTTVTTVLGVMPLILSEDPLFYSMAIILASGLIFGTLLTLGVVPVLYALMFRVRAPRKA